MNKLIELGRSSIGLIEFNYRKIASLASNGMPLKKAFQKVYPGQEVPSASTIRKRMQSESGSSAKKRDFRRESYLRPSKPSLFESEEEAIELARKQSPRRAHNAAMRKKYGPEWYKVKSRKYKKPKPVASKQTKKRAKPSAMSKVGGFTKGRYGYGTIGGLGGLAIGGVLGRMSRKKEE
jgi:hypothetical protein